MARIRSIKPEFWTSEQILDLSHAARLAFIGLWNFSDDEGRHKASGKSLKAEVFPGDDLTVANVDAMMDELIRSDLIDEYYDDEGRHVWQITGWTKHQKISHPTPSKFGPKPPKDELNDRGTLFDNSRNGANRGAKDSVKPTEDSGALRNLPEDSSLKGVEGKGKEGIRRESRGGEGMQGEGRNTADAVVAANTATPPDDILLLRDALVRYNAMAKKAGLAEAQRLTKDRKSKLRQRLDEADGIEGWQKALDNLAASAFCTGDNDRNWRADFDFMLQAKSFTKLMEGAYDTRPDRRTGGNRPRGVDAAAEIIQEIHDEGAEQ